jgi:putative FmdB family regulatory protein
MPLYLYRREDGTTFEQRQKFSDDPLNTCPTTGQAVHRIPQASGIIFKGSGFYVNDNKSATKPSPTPATDNAGKADSAPAATTEGTASAKADTKTQSKSDAAD